MSNATVSAFIDKYHPQKDGNCKVSIRVTHQRIKKYYPTNLSLKAKDFERVMTAKRRSETDNAIYKKIHSFEDKAMKAIENLPVFTFGIFENIYLQNREAADSIAFGFDKYISELTEEKRIGTAVSYDVAKKSIESFKKGLRYADITPTLLRKYENWMLEKWQNQNNGRNISSQP